MNWKNQYENVYEDLCVLENYIDEMIQKPLNEYDKGWNSASKSIRDHLAVIKYEMEGSCPQLQKSVLDEIFD